MDYERPTTWKEALELKARRPEAVPLLGGTDLMVEMNFRRARPPVVLDLTRIGELTGWDQRDDYIRIAAGITFSELVDSFRTRLPALAAAARTVGSPQIRNRGTIAGNLGTASPAGDVHPPLLAAAAEVELASVKGLRRIPIDEFFLGPRKNALGPNELISAVFVPVAEGLRHEQFAKIGARNAMVIAACSFAICVDRAARSVRTGIGSAGPTPLRALAAERFLEGALHEAGGWDTNATASDTALRRFGQLVASAARPIDDIRATAAYRRHALSVLAARTARWALADHAEGGV